MDDLLLYLFICLGLALLLTHFIAYITVSHCQLSHVGSGPGFKPLTPEVVSNCVTHYTTEFQGDLFLFIGKHIDLFYFLLQQKMINVKEYIFT